MSTERDNQNEIIDVRGLLAEYASKWYLFLACIIACTGIAYLYTKTTQPVYDIKANILISQDEERGGSGGLLANFGDIAGMFGSKGKVDDEVFIVKSHSVYRDVVKDLAIYKKHYVKPAPFVSIFKYRDAPVDVYCDPAIPDTLMTSIRFRVRVSDKGKVDATALVRGKKIDEVEDASFPVTMKLPYGRFIINKTPYFKPGESLKTDITLSGYNVAAEGLETDVEVYVANKKANVITLATSSTDTDYARDLLNSVILNYNQRGIQDRNLKSQKTADFIDSRLALLSTDLTDTEKGIEQFKKDQNMTDIMLDANYNLSKKGALEQELVKAQTQVEINKMLLDFVNDPGNKYSLIPTTAGNMEAVQAISAYNAVVLQYIDLSRNARANNVPLKKVEEQLEAMRASMQVAFDKNYRAALAAARELQTEVNASQGRLGQMPYQERIYRSIMRQQEIKEQLYLFLLQRREETSMTLANSVPKGIIVDEAYSLSEPKGMGKMAIILIGFFFGLCLAPVILYIRRSLRNKFETKDELEKLSKIPILGEMCNSRMGKTLVVEPGSRSSAVELFGLIRTNLKFVLSNPGEKVVLMTSTVSGEGKSFISINLAASLALLGKKVLLVGMDIRAPKLAEYLPIHPAHGLTEYLAGDSLSIDDIILKNPCVDGMDIIVSGPVPPNPSELLQSDKVDELFERLRTMYDYIIVDSAPVGMVSDSFALARISDATVYVCRANYTTLRDVKFFNDLYEEGRLKKMSLVVNGTSTSKGYGYGYGVDFDRNGKQRKHRKQK